MSKTSRAMPGCVALEGLEGQRRDWPGYLSRSGFLGIPKTEGREPPGCHVAPDDSRPNSVTRSQWITSSWQRPSWRLAFWQRPSWRLASLLLRLFS